jgi:hypothetical protein
MPDEGHLVDALQDLLVPPGDGELAQQGAPSPCSGFDLSDVVRASIRQNHNSFIEQM